MDVDAYVSVNRGDWDRLERLTAQRRLSADEIDELVETYQRSATHLSAVRSSTADPRVVGRLSRLLVTARAAMTGVSEPWTREVARFFAVSFPVAVWRSRWWTLAMTVLTLVIALASGWWVHRDPVVQAAVFGSQADIRQLVEVDFENYYSESPAASFSAKVWTNNAWVAARCIAFGILGLPVIAIIAMNAAAVGMTAGVMAANDRLGLFFALILPHGLLELTAVFVAAGAGMMLFWSWVSPGAMTRTQAMAREGRSMITVALGLVVVLLISGVIEGFVTPSPLPTWARIGIGAIAWLGFGAYVWHYGRRAALAGESGDLRAEDREDTLPAVAS